MVFGNINEQYEKIAKNSGNNIGLLHPDILLENLQSKQENDVCIGTTYYDVNTKKVFDSKDEFVQHLTMQAENESRELCSQKRIVIKPYYKIKYHLIKNISTYTNTLHDKLTTQCEQFMIKLNNEKYLSECELNISSYFFSGIGLGSNNLGYDLEELQSAQTPHTSHLIRELIKLLNNKIVVESNRKKIYAFIYLSNESLKLYHLACDLAGAYDFLFADKEEKLFNIVNEQRKIVQVNVENLNNCRIWSENLLERLTDIQDDIINAIKNKLYINGPSLITEYEEVQSLAYSASVIAAKLTKKKSAVVNVDKEIFNATVNYDHVLIPPIFNESYIKTRLS